MSGGVPDQLYTLYFGVHKKAAMLACDVCGVVPGDMLFVARKHFKRSSKDTKDQILIRYTMHERQRQAMFHKLLEEKEKLLRDPDLSRKWKDRKRILQSAPPPPKISKKKLKKAKDALIHMMYGTTFPEEKGNVPITSPSIPLESFPQLLSHQLELTESPDRPLGASTMPTVDSGENSPLAIFFPSPLPPTAVESAATEEGNGGSPAVMSGGGHPSPSFTMREDKPDGVFSASLARDLTPSSVGSPSIQDPSGIMAAIFQKGVAGAEGAYSSFGQTENHEHDKGEGEAVADRVEKESGLQKRSTEVEARAKTEPMVASAAGSSPLKVGATTGEGVVYKAPPPAEDVESGMGVGGAYTEGGAAAPLSSPASEETTATPEDNMREVMKLFLPTCYSSLGVLKDDTQMHPSRWFPGKPPLPPPSRTPRTRKSLQKEVKELNETKRLMTQCSLPVLRQKAWDRGCRNTDSNGASTEMNGRVKTSPTLLEQPYPFLPAATIPFAENGRWTTSAGVHTASSPLLYDGAAYSQAPGSPCTEGSLDKKIFSGDEGKDTAEARKKSTRARQSASPNANGKEEGVRYPSPFFADLCKEETPTLPLQSRGGDQYSAQSKVETAHSSFAGSMTSRQEGVGAPHRVLHAISPQDGELQNAAKRKQKKKSSVARMDLHFRQVELIKRVAVIDAKHAENAYLKGLKNMEEEVPPQGTISHRIHTTSQTVKPPPLDMRLQESRKKQEKGSLSVQEQQNLRDRQLVEKVNHGAMQAERRKEEIQLRRKEVNENRRLLFKEQLTFAKRRKDIEMRQKLAKVEKRHHKANTFNQEKFKDMATRRRVEHDREGILRRMVKQELQKMSQSKQWKVQKINQITA